MYLINEANFTREISVPNLTSSQSGNAENLNKYGDEKPRLLLQNSLGSVLFTDLDSQVTNGILDNDADQKWKDLVNGKEYDGKVWKGLNYEEGSFKVSLLAYFTYCNWLSDSLSSNLQVQVKNAENVNDTNSLVNVWNTFIQMYQGGVCEIGKRIYNINGTTFVDWYD